METHPVCPAADFPPGEVRLVEVNDVSVGVFNVDGEYHALLNECPHRGGPLCEGRVVGLVSSSEPGELSVERDGEIVRCPWHSWEFDIATGELVLEPDELRTRTYDAGVELADGVDLDDVAAETVDVSVEEEIVVVRV